LNLSQYEQLRNRGTEVYLKQLPENTGRFIMFSVITNIYNKKSKGRTLMELLTATGKLRKLQ
jgi:hypothetical protein